MTSLSLNEGLTSLGYFTFHDCSSLKEVTFPSTLTNITTTAFVGCTGLEAFHVAESNPAFSEKAGVVFNKAGDKLCFYAFNGCSGLKQVTFPSSLTTIEYNAFNHCTGLTAIDLPDNVTSLGGSAFMRCEALESVHFGRGITRIYGSVFAACGLKSVEIPLGSL